jgi:aminoglycoside 3-N-acetyltransferase
MTNRLYLFQSTAKAAVYYFLRRTLSQSRRAKMKKWQGKARKNTQWALKLVHGAYTAREIAEEIERNLPPVIDILMVHSSYDRLPPVYSGTPQELVKELVALCQVRNCTLAMPACFLYDAKSYYQTREFDVKRTISEMGLLTEVFRRMPGVKRSLHPTHSICAIGPLSDELTRTHHLASTRTGKGTPFETMAKNRTAITGIGVEYFRCLTQVHTAEDLLGAEFPVEYHRETIPVKLIDWDNQRLTYNLTIMKTRRSLDNRLLRPMLSETDLKQWSFRGTPLFVTDAGKVTGALLDAARRGLTLYREYTVG